MNLVHQLYKQEIAPCPRSPEWKKGALAGMYKADKQQFECSPYATGTAQSDAWLAGFQYGYVDFSYRAPVLRRPK